jgi:hypothetical protein
LRDPADQDPSEAAKTRESDAVVDEEREGESDAVVDELAGDFTDAPDRLLVRLA